MHCIEASTENSPPRRGSEKLRRCWSGEYTHLRDDPELQNCLLQFTRIWSAISNRGKVLMVTLIRFEIIHIGVSVLMLIAILKMERCQFPSCWTPEISIPSVYTVFVEGRVLFKVLLLIRLIRCRVKVRCSTQTPTITAMGEYTSVPSIY
jgi:hypothetical protein